MASTAEQRKLSDKYENEATKNEMVGCHHRLNGHEFKQTLGGNEGQAACHAAVHGTANSWT